MDTQTPGTQTAPEAIPPVAQLMQILGGCLPSQAVYVAAKIGVADLLKDGPLNIRELAAQTTTHERSLYRLLRSLAGVGIFTETEQNVFGLTPSAEFLLTEHAGSLRDAAIFMGEKWHWAVYGDMIYSVQTGKVAWKHVHGLEVFPYLQQKPEEYEIFNRAMTSLSLSTLPSLIEAYNFGGVETLILRAVTESCWQDFSKQIRSSRACCLIYRK
ncbi:MAG: acetylserotonin O-methyltransferase [Acidobacteriota bacterium]|nr:acetylserotonin O-methyltransferase [Acidobacteriota bacterium]